MRFMVLVKATKDSEAGKLPDMELLQAMGAYNEELAKAGVLLSGEGLRPSKDGARVRFSGERRTAIEGPFPLTSDLVAGFWIWKVASKEEAIAWLKRCPNPHPGSETEVELRRIYETEDFAPADPTGEFRAAEDDLRRRLDG